jgi:hypothetical protein
MKVLYIGTLSDCGFDSYRITRSTQFACRVGTFEMAGQVPRESSRQAISRSEVDVQNWRLPFSATLILILK